MNRLVLSSKDGSFFVSAAGRLPSDIPGLLPAQDTFDRLDGDIPENQDACDEKGGMKK